MVASTLSSGLVSNGADILCSSCGKEACLYFLRCSNRIKKISVSQCLFLLILISTSRLCCRIYLQSLFLRTDTVNSIAQRFTFTSEKMPVSLPGHLCSICMCPYLKIVKKRIITTRDLKSSQRRDTRDRPCNGHGHCCHSNFVKIREERGKSFRFPKKEKIKDSLCVEKKVTSASLKKNKICR